MIGIGCRFPGAGNADEYWGMIKRAGTAISPLPESRLDRDLYYHPEKGRIGSTYTALSGLVPETPFDHNRFPIPGDLLSSYDSVHLRMLEVCCEAVTSAGMDPLSGLGGSRTGVYIGNTSGSTLAGDLTFGTLSTEVVSRLRDSEFADLPADMRERAIQRTIAQIQANSPVRNANGGPNVEAHDVSVLVSRAMQLDGPAVAVDAACASALIATAQAVYALQRGYLDMAIAGGCSFSKWFALILFSQAQSISGTGTRPFDQDADGLISSDGYAAIVLKPLSRALADGDSILSVIRNLAVGSDGKGKSLWAPRREGQIHAVRRAYNAEVSPGSLQYIECHATSTQVGDATEISALSEAMHGAFPPGHKIPIGSVKGNIGHTLECAGLAGVCKTIQALRHGVIPPQPSIKELNPDIAWDDIPFYVPTSAQPWPGVNQQGVRRAAVNAFGIGGLNAHVVLDDRPEPQRMVHAAVPADIQSADVSADDDLIAVIGVGVIAPDANNQEEFWSLISSGKSAVSEVTDDRWVSAHYHTSEPGPRCSSSKLGGFVRNFEFNWKKHRIPPKQIQNSNPLQYMLLDAADQAFIDAGLGDMEFPRERASVVVGTMFGGDFSSHMQVGLRLPVVQRELKKALMADGLDETQADSIVARYREHALNIYPAVRDETGSFTSSTLASRLTKSFDLMGGAWAIDAADVSSFVCLRAAADLLLTGSSDMVMCAAGQRSMDVSSFELMDLQGRLSGDRVAPAFDANQNGGVPGEAVGIVLLKRLADAERDGDRIRGVIRGIEVSFTDQNRADGIAKNLKRLMPADGQAARIDALETARVCSPALDAAEIEGMQRALPDQPAPLALGSTSKQIGYSLSASGMISVIKAMLELEHQSIAPVAADAEPSELVRRSGSQFTLPHQLSPLGSQLPPGAGRIMVSNMDPSGAIGHLIVEGVKERMNVSAPLSAATPPTMTQTPAEEPDRFEILRVAAPSTSELEAVVAAGVASRNSGFGSDDGVRLGIVATGPDDLTRKLPATRMALADCQRRHILGDNGILIAEPGRQGKHLAVVFSGQGAQYTGMLADWIRTSVAVQQFIEQANTVLASLNLPSFEFLTQDTAADLGNHVLNTQLAVLLADLAAWAALTEAGVRPDFIAGHSYGEFPALVAAGAWDLNAALQATIHRTNAVEGAGVSNAAMLSTTAEPATVTSLIQKLQLPCDIACYNAPDQTIIAGRISDLDQLSEELKTGGYASRTIRVPMPYHSRMMQAAQAPLEAALQQIPISTPAVRFISCCSSQPLETPDEIRASLVAELTHPVRWETLVETLIASDTGVVFESGPRQILTRLNRRIIGARPVLHLALDARPGHAREQQARIRLLLEMFQETPSAATQHSAESVLSGPPSVPVPVDSVSAPVNAPEVTASTQRVNHTPSEKTSMTDDRKKGRIIWVDATERRRSKMREAAQAKAAGRPVANRTSDNGFGARSNGAPASVSGNGVPVSGSGNGVHPASRTVQTGPADPHTGNGVSSAVSIAAVPSIEPQVAGTAPQAEKSTLSQPVAAAQVSSEMELSRDKLESFVLDYVVEQTGYPPELVELDANLEADLGVDSIRKAQLMGEISETFQIQQAREHINDLSLDDFPDLSSIIDFFLRICESPDAVQTAASVVPQVSSVPQVPDVPSVSSPAFVSPTVQDVLPNQDDVTAAGRSIDREDLANFAVRFVVEQTGYPEELVELDTNLEADLGIDSIRKAQLLGEIAENYEMTGLAGQITDLSLDDFPTLNSIVDFFVGQAGSGAAAEPLPVPSGHTPPSTMAPVAPAIQAPTAPTVAMPAIPAVAVPVTPMVPVVETAPKPVPAIPVASTDVSVSKDELMTFAIAFVVEQTGYPEELVEPNADLEADLGIDSIRKAQLLGEIAEHYQMTGLAGQITDLSLDDFPTLEAITDFFFAAAGRTTEHGADTVIDDVAAPGLDTSTTKNTVPAVAGSADLTSVDRLPENDRIMQRYIVRSIPESLREASDAVGTTFAGKVVILGEDRDAQALVQRLQSAGSLVEILPASIHAQSAVAAFETSWKQQAVDHLIVMTSNGDQPADWDTLRDQQLLVPYFVIQKWVQLRTQLYGKDSPPAGNLAAITRLGGDFGIGGRIGNVSGAGLAGLFKAIIREHAELNATVLDVPADEPVRLVIDALCREAAAAGPHVEIGCIRGKRHRLHMIPQPASGICPSDVSLAGPWVVTGGARGITARIAAALGRSSGVRLHLVGRSSESEVDPAWVALDETGLGELKKDVMRKAAAENRKPIDAWNSLNSKITLAKSLRKLREQGLDVTYHACDVSQRDSVGNMLQAVRQMHGPITGVIHGAGVEAAARFERKQADSVRLTVTSKVDGARWLWEHTANDDLSYFVCFGSTSGRFGGLGQTDYSMASDLLCRMGWQFGIERPACRTVGFHWPPWGEVGMAARPESRFALESAGLKFVEPDEGVSHLLDELDIRSSEGEVAVVDRVWGMSEEDELQDTKFIELAHSTKSRVRNAAFVDAIIRQSENSLTTEVVFDPLTHPMLRDHKVDGIAVVPGTVMLETCQQAAGLLDRERLIIGVRDYQILNGVRCRSGKQRLVVHVVRETDGVIRCEVTGAFTDQEGCIVDPARVYASATILTGAAPVAGTVSKVPLPEKWEILQQAAGPNDFRSNHVGTVYHGPSLGRLRGIANIEGSSGWFRVADPDGTCTPEGMARPAVLDAFLQGIDIILHRSRGTSQLPTVIGQADLHTDQLDQDELIVRVAMTHEADDTSYWTIDCFSPAGIPVVSMKDVEFRRMKSSPATVPVGGVRPVPVAPPGTPSVEKIIRPMMLRAGINVDGNAAAVAVPVNPLTDRFLSEHKLHNVPLLPAVMAIEIMAEAGEVLAEPGERTIAIRDMQILSGIKCTGTNVRTLVVRCLRSGNDVTVQMFKSPEAEKPSMTATIALGMETLPMESGFSQPHGEFMDYPYPKDAPIQHGPSFQTLRKLAPWRFLGTAHLQIGESCLADDFPAEAQWVIDPAILDGALVGCGSDAWLYYGFTPELPHSFDEIIVGKMIRPREVCTAEFKCCTTFKEDTTTYNIVMQDSKNRTFMQVKGFSLKRLMPVKPGWLTMGGY